ncbi:BZ3500_MvSof-1268-A1-R1_Chr3-1g05927 [Microbotryum saponariae]|uniref:BZ3500_MvSof-1268-A1-R1_Chr3-1g05927 protein n=1 Tax=Microbotryum saponariae TaxID=289078 RepID=A0A2X0NIN4_9BASI|nr:BZ3500_MvSof-1268-A1-R1_Chr3-1g05927 [Microbotryum saponariae]SDA05117.1 BZ3501_MvSof-1269-A2-R1_Chr3-1g05597 [Microbotryum saponariae]
MSSTAAPLDTRIQLLLADVLEIPDEQFAAMSPVAELTVGELLAFKYTRPDLTATLTVPEFEPTFHQHQIRPVSTTRALFNKSHELRVLYASGCHSIEVRDCCRILRGWCYWVGSDVDGTLARVGYVERRGQFRPGKVEREKLANSELDN